jgi:Protein of unknown function (DUF4239)
VSSLLTVCIIFACMLSAILLGSYLRYVLPDHHTQADSKDILMTAAGTMATLIALIIGLLVSSAKDSYDVAAASITQGSAKIITLDYYLSGYGPEAGEVRDRLPQAITSAIERIWPHESTHGADLAKMEVDTEMADIYNKIRELSPKNDSQRYLQTEALKLSADMMKSRWMLIEESQTSLPRVFLIIVTFWLTVLFVQFGLLAPRNLTAKSALLICAISMSSAIFLILELNRPLEGCIKVSSAPMHKALTLIGK